MTNRMGKTKMRTMTKNRMNKKEYRIVCWAAANPVSIRPADLAYCLCNRHNGICNRHLVFALTDIFVYDRHLRAHDTNMSIKASSTSQGLI